MKHLSIPAPREATIAVARELLWYVQRSGDDVEALVKSAGLLRASRHVALLKDVVRRAQAEWPALLADAPAAMRQAVEERLRGGVKLAVA